jgi:hypothetical protein
MEIFGDPAFLDEVVASIPEPGTLATLSAAFAMTMRPRRTFGQGV